MADTIITTQTYGCTCGYRLQGVDPYSDYYVTTFDVPAGMCASCKTEKLGMVLDVAEQSTHTVADDATLEATTEAAFNADGTPAMEPTGQTTYQINQQTGQIEQVDVMAQKQVPITQERLNELTLQRNQSLDALAPITVSETTV